MGNESANLPCRCGSNRKYKKCCKLSDEQADKKEFHDGIIEFLKDVDLEAGRVRPEAEYEAEFQAYVQHTRNVK